MKASQCVALCRFRCFISSEQPGSGPHICVASVDAVRSGSALFRFAGWAKGGTSTGLADASCDGARHL